MVPTTIALARHSPVACRPGCEVVTFVISEAAEPLAERSIVVCRSEAQAESTVRRLRDLGAEPVLVPVIEITAPADGGAALGGHLRDLEDYDWIVFTSANGVRAVHRAAIDHHLEWPLHIRVAAVGPASAEELKTRGQAVDFVPARSMAAELAASIPITFGRRVLAPLAELAADDLRAGLEQRGFDVDRIDAYRLLPLADLEPELVDDAVKADAALFTSPSTVDRFLELSEGRHPPAVISIGPRTSRRLADHGVVVTAEADPHTEEGLIAALMNTLKV